MKAVMFGIIAFFLYHVFEIFIKPAKSDIIPNIGKLMLSGFVGVIPMQLIIGIAPLLFVIGKILSVQVGLLILVIFQVFKMIVDLFFHSKAYRTT